MRAVVVGTGFAGACAGWWVRQWEGAQVRVREQAPAESDILRASHAGARVAVLRRVWRD